MTSRFSTYTGPAQVVDFLSARYYEKDGTLHFAGFNADLGVTLEDLRKKEK